ncbi:helix-turn-helix domain-containing protein [Intestinibacillus massiliensis]|uniref:helix-turn-helix domain-containing protein n=1 Tax=Intestinibacillus massiliensis TaxID=1871029 RepID=UPI000B35D4B7|nr:helix-turn-helix transcriptional regulator [Intestinibacillus massiliensis]
MFYDKFAELCSKKGVTPTRAALEIGLSKSTPTSWKNRGLTPQGDTLSKIADYFGVSTDYLLGNEQKEKPTGKSVDISDEDIKFALSGGEGVITDEQFEEVKKFVQFIKERDKHDQK